MCHTDSTAILEVGGHEYQECPSCRHQFLDLEPCALNVEEHYGDGYFSGEGDGYSDYLRGGDLLCARGRRYARRIARLTGKRSGRLLDIGSAAGFLSRGFQESGWDVQGIEPNLSMAAHANKIEGVPTINARLDEFDTDDRFDLILLVQVIAHLEDPGSSLRRIRSLLKPGGHVLIETWDNQSLTAKLLKGRWHEYNPPSVLHAFSRKSLATLAELQGFAEVGSKRTIKSIKAAHGKALLSHRYGHSKIHHRILKPTLRALPDSINLPYPADDLFWTCLAR